MACDKTAAEVAMAAMQTGLGGNGGDGSDKMTSVEVAQDWLVIRRPHQQDKGNCGSNGGGANLTWLGISGKTAIRQQKQRQNVSNSINGGG